MEKAVLRYASDELSFAIKDSLSDDLIYHRDRDKTF